MTALNPVGGAGEDLRLSVQPRNYLRPCLLLLLAEEPTYGYEVREKLTSLSPGHWDPGTVYRALNTMEDDGLVASTWERSAEGPRRRRYEITDAGRGDLGAWARELCAVRNTIIDFLGRYEAGQHSRQPLPAIPGHAHSKLMALGAAPAPLAVEGSGAAGEKPRRARFRMRSWGAADARGSSAAT